MNDDNGLANAIDALVQARVGRGIYTMSRRALRFRSESSGLEFWMPPDPVLLELDEACEAALNNLRHALSGETP